MFSQNPGLFFSNPYFRSITETIRTSGTVVLGANVLDVLGYSPEIPSMSTLMQINAAGNFYLSIIFGTWPYLESSSFGCLLLTSIKDSISNAPFNSRVLNTIVGATGLTVREVIGATVGYALFTLANIPTDITFPAFLTMVCVGSCIFSTTLPIVTEMMKIIVEKTHSELPPVLKNNADNLFMLLGGARSPRIQNELTENSERDVVRIKK